MPEHFVFLSLSTFKKMTSNERQAYLESLARYVGAVQQDLSADEKKIISPSLSDATLGVN